MHFRTARPPTILLVLLLVIVRVGPASGGEPVVGASGLPLPRFVSLRASEINLRIGPGTRFPIDWVYHRPGLPVEVINEHQAWRQIRDHENTVGWVHMSMLSGRRNALVIGALRTLRHDPDEQSRPVARLEPGVIGALERCEQGWCLIAVDGVSGWLPRGALYGLYDDEELQ